MKTEEMLTFTSGWKTKIDKMQLAESVSRNIHGSRICRYKLLVLVSHGVCSVLV